MHRSPSTDGQPRRATSLPHLLMLLALVVSLASITGPATLEAEGATETETVNASGQPGTGEGRVNFFMHHDAELDRFTQNPSADTKRWFQQRYARMTAYSSYFDSRTSWYRDAWLYADAYAIYNPSELAGQRAEWILRDAPNGNRLYIPYDCDDGACPQFAADIGNPAWRAHWIDQVRAKLTANAYHGIFVDDVNMALKVADGSGREVAPHDPRTGTTMTLADWRDYMATFMEEVRHAFPTHEIVHNQVYFFAPISDASVRRTVAAADYIQIERGFNDMNIPGGGGAYGFETLLNYIDAYHAAGANVITYVVDRWGREYGLAAYLLVTNGKDLLGNKNGGLPDNWWAAGYEVDLGPAAGMRYQWQDLFRRDFVGGIVLVNQPGEPAKTVALEGRYVDLSGQERTLITLNEREGVVLRRLP